MQGNPLFVPRAAGFPRPPQKSLIWLTESRGTRDRSDRLSPSSLWIGVGTAGFPAAPPSEPYVRISRIRLSSRWFTAERIDRPGHGLW